MWICCSESCDDARVEDSLKVQNMVFEERRKQLDERMRLKEEEVTHLFSHIKLAECPMG